MQSISQELYWDPKEHIFDFYISINYFQTHLHRIITKRKETKLECNAIPFISEAASEMKGIVRTCVHSAWLPLTQFPASTWLLEGVRANMIETAFRLIKASGSKKIKHSGLSFANLTGLEAAGGPSIQNKGWRWLL